MLKALVKKQLTELLYQMVGRGRNGKKRNSGSMAVMAIILGFVFLLLMFSFFGISVALGMALFEQGLHWLYYALLSMIAILLGLVGSIFGTYSSLYQAKDNELLLSMPIPPSKILISRMIAIWIMSFFYTSLIWIPAMAFPIVDGQADALSIVGSLLVWIAIPFLVTVFSCLLGWVVAMVAVHVKNKSLITVLVSLILFGLYYYVILQMNEFLEMLITYASELGNVFQTWVVPLYWLGNGASGDFLSLMLFLLMTVVLFALCLFILSKTFFRATAMKSAVKKGIYHPEKDNRAKKPSAALFGRELNHFLASPTYLLNSGLGLAILPILAILALVYRDMIFGVVEELSAFMNLQGALPVYGAGIVGLLLSMNAISTPSVSLEGKTLWQIRVLPISSWEIIKGKEQLHLIFNGICAILTCLILGIALEFSVLDLLLMTLFSVLFTWFIDDLGLVIGIKHPKMEWTNESVPIKQSIGVMILLFGGWLVSVLMMGIYFPLMFLMPAWCYLLIMNVLYGVLVFFMRRWLKTKGVQIFEEISC